VLGFPAPNCHFLPHPLLIWKYFEAVEEGKADLYNDRVQENEDNHECSYDLFLL
jgi:hypothetical protein